MGRRLAEPEQGEMAWSDRPVDKIPATDPSLRRRAPRNSLHSAQRIFDKRQRLPWKRTRRSVAAASLSPRDRYSAARTAVRDERKAPSCAARCRHIEQQFPRSDLRILVCSSGIVWIVLRLLVASRRCDRFEAKFRALEVLRPVIGMHARRDLTHFNTATRVRL